MKRADFGKLVLLAAVLALLIPMVLIADDDEDNDMPSEQVTQTETMDSLTDSVYMLINKSYQDVRPILERSCFDCHSSLTDFPWYHSLPLIGGMLDSHVKEGREHLDLTNDFPFGGHGGQVDHLNEIKEQIEEGEMPLWSYRLMHWGTAVEGERRDSLFAWIDESLKLLQTQASEQQSH